MRITAKGREVSEDKSRKKTEKLTYYNTNHHDERDDIVDIRR